MTDPTMLAAARVEEQGKWRRWVLDPEDDICLTYDPAYPAWVIARDGDWGTSVSARVADLILSALQQQARVVEVEGCGFCPAFRALHPLHCKLDRRIPEQPYSTRPPWCPLPVTLVPKPPESPPK